MSAQRPGHGPRLAAMFAAALLLFAGGAYAAKRYILLSAENERRGAEMARLEDELRDSRETSARLTEALAIAEGKTNELERALLTEQDRNRYVQTQIQELTNKVGGLTKLAELDPELLKKYSKVYFLSENYAPPALTAVDPHYLHDPQKTSLILGPVRPYLESMLASAERNGTPLKVISGYRSYHEQLAVKTGYKVLYGTGANQFSADQGYSEHQLGTTVDLIPPGATGLSTSFEKSPAYAWLLENAWRFGFVLSYPKNNLYYQFEPWHWRFVGVALATKLHNDKMLFYELGQREIDAYLIEIFN